MTSATQQAATQWPFKDSGGNPQVGISPGVGPNGGVLTEPAAPATGLIASTLGSKVTKTVTSVSANASTQIAPPNANRVALVITAGAGNINVDETGATLSSAGLGNGTLFLPTAQANIPYVPPVATQSALTAYTATAQTVVVTEYSR